MHEKETKQARWARLHPEERRKIHREGQARRRAVGPRLGREKKKPAIADGLDVESVLDHLEKIGWVRI